MEGLDTQLLGDVIERAIEGSPEAVECVRKIKDLLLGTAPLSVDEWDSVQRVFEHDEGEACRETPEGLIVDLSKVR